MEESGNPRCRRPRRGQEYIDKNCAVLYVTRKRISIVEGTSVTADMRQH